MNEKKEIKKINQHLISVKLEELQKLVPFIKEKNNILIELNSESIQDFELKVNKATKFVNATMSASALGFETQYKRLLELENLIGGKLTQADLNAKNELSNNLISKVKEKFTTYFTDEELTVRKELDQVIKIYNALDFKDRQHIGFNSQRQLGYTNFSELR